MFKKWKDQIRFELKEEIEDWKDKQFNILYADMKATMVRFINANVFISKINLIFPAFVSSITVIDGKNYR